MKDKLHNHHLIIKSSYRKLHVFYKKARLRFIKTTFRAIYRSLPFKKAVLTFLRDTGIASRVPLKLKRFLLFEGTFSVEMEDTNFLMVIGYGFEIESSLFWMGADSYEYEPETAKIWKQLSRQAKYIFDVGANTGVYSLFAKSVNPHAQVYAFEPLKRVFSILEENNRINKQRNPEFDIHCFRMALSDYSGEGLMYDLPVEHMYTASLNRNTHQERGQSMQAVTEAVPVMRIADFLHNNSVKGLDLIKIDVESHEPSVIRGIAPYLVQYHPTMIVEIWNNEVGAEVEKALEECSYYYFAIEEQGPKLMPHIRNDQPEKGYINYLFCTNCIAAELNLL